MIDLRRRQQLTGGEGGWYSVFVDEKARWNRDSGKFSPSSELFDEWEFFFLKRKNETKKYEKKNNVGGVFPKKNIF